MGQITWRNVDAPDLSNAVRTQQLAVKNFQDALTNIAAIPGQTAENVQAGIDRTDTTLLNNFLSNLNKMDSSKGIEQAESDGTFDNLLAGVTDEKQLKARDAVQSQLDKILGREKGVEDARIASERLKLDEGQLAVAQQDAATTEKIADADIKHKNAQTSAIREQTEEARRKAAYDKASSKILLDNQNFIANTAGKLRTYNLKVLDQIAKVGGIPEGVSPESFVTATGMLDVNALETAITDPAKREKVLAAIGRARNTTEYKELAYILTNPRASQERVFKMGVDAGLPYDVLTGLLPKAAQNYTTQTKGTPESVTAHREANLAFLRENAKYNPKASAEYSYLSKGYQTQSEYLHSDEYSNLLAKVKDADVLNKVGALTRKPYLVASSGEKVPMSLGMIKMLISAAQKTENFYNFYHDSDAPGSVASKIADAELDRIPPGTKKADAEVEADRRQLPSNPDMVSQITAEGARLSQAKVFNNTLKVNTSKLETSPQSALIDTLLSKGRGDGVIFENKEEAAAWRNYIAKQPPGPYKTAMEAVINSGVQEATFGRVGVSRAMREKAVVTLQKYRKENTK